jgi:DNA repair exonuclease SbcCD nuclease subunit
VTRILHTGDTHVGYQQYHSPTRREDFIAAFRRVLDDAVASDVDAVVHAGDLFHDRSPALRDLLATVGALRTLRDADVPFLAVVGNHEGTRDAQWLDLFERLGLATRLGEDPVRVGDAAFYGLDYVPKAKRDALDYDFTPDDAAHAALVSHGLFQPFPHGDWDLRAVLDSSPVDFDAVLLGDDHQHDVREVAGATATYCGSTERASASERDPRGYSLVTFDEGVRLARRGIETRDFVFVDETLAAGEGAPLLRERIREADVEGAVVVVTVEGEGADLVPAEIEAFGDEQGALVTRVNDRRERATAATETEVSFADPDAAVDERLRELGLSEAAHDVDAVVRGDAPDATVRDRVRERVTALDPAAFDPADGDDDGGEPTPETETENAAGETPARDGRPESDGTDEAAATDGDRGEADGAPADEDAGQTGIGEYL